MGSDEASEARPKVQGVTAEILKKRFCLCEPTSGLQVRDFSGHPQIDLGRKRSQTDIYCVRTHLVLLSRQWKGLQNGSNSCR